MANEQDATDIGKASEITLDKSMRIIVSELVEHDNTEAQLEVTINEGLENEAVILFSLLILAINGKMLTEDIDNG